MSNERRFIEILDVVDITILIDVVVSTPFQQYTPLMLITSFTDLELTSECCAISNQHVSRLLTFDHLVYNVLTVDIAMSTISNQHRFGIAYLKVCYLHRLLP